MRVTPDRGIAAFHGIAFYAETEVQIRHDVYKPTWNEAGLGAVVTYYSSQGHFILKVESCQERIEEQMKRMSGLHKVESHLFHPLTSAANEYL